jgi:hypothetical protein
MDGRMQRWFKGYTALSGTNKALFWIIGIAAFAVSLTIIVLVRRNVDLAALPLVSIAQLLAGILIGALASLTFLYLKTNRSKKQHDDSRSNNLRDLIYFDSDKAASILSQIEGGLLTESQESAEEVSERRRSARLGPIMFQPEFGTTRSERTAVLESKVLHHGLLTRLEQGLKDMGMLLNINEAVDSDDPDYSDKGLHDLITKPSFIVAEGWAALEDFNRVDAFISDFPNLVEFINRCATHGIQGSDAYKAMQETIVALTKEVRQEKDSKRKAQLKLQQRQLEEQAEQLLASVETVEDIPPDWLLEGIRSFITTLIPNRVNLRIYPFEQNPRFEVLSNLKAEYFMDSDLENIRFAYGTRPNVPFTALGLVTSIPREKNKLFDPVAELEHHPTSEDDQIELGFRHLLRTFADFERFVRFSHYPNVTVYPIAVYQKLDKVAHDDLDKPRSDGDKLVGREAEQARLQRASRVRDID